MRIGMDTQSDLTSRASKQQPHRRDRAVAGIKREIARILTGKPPYRRRHRKNTTRNFHRGDDGVIAISLSVHNPRFFEGRVLRGIQRGEHVVTFGGTTAKENDRPAWQRAIIARMGRAVADRMMKTDANTAFAVLQRHAVTTVQYKDKARQNGRGTDEMTDQEKTGDQPLADRSPRPGACLSVFHLHLLYAKPSFLIIMNWQ